MLSTITGLSIFTGLVAAFPQGGTPTTDAEATITDPGAATRVDVLPQQPATVAPQPLAAAALGTADVINHCNFPVYLYVCDGASQTCSAERTLAAHTGTYSEGFHALNDGRSIKIGLTSGEVAKPIMQLEYTNGNNNLVYYDLSEINGNPFGPYGFTLTSSQCGNVACHPPANTCDGVYTSPPQPSTKACANTSNVGVTLCTG